MLRFISATFLSLVPGRWRRRMALPEAMPWRSAGTLSGFLESLMAFSALVYWYSHSVTTWAANALDSALRNGPESSVPGQAIGFSALVLWAIHPLTWLIAYFAMEGVVRMLAAAFTEKIHGTLLLVMVDWSYGKLTGRPAEGDGLHTPSRKAQLQSFLAVANEKILVARLPELQDELIERVEGDETILEIHASRPKNEWIPSRMVRIGDTYFRLEELQNARPPRPFVFRLTRLPAGVPGRTVIVYEPAGAGKRH